MFSPKYTITNEILKLTGQIDAAREIVEGTAVIPAWDLKLKKDAIERMAYYSAHLDGNDLSHEQVQDLLDGKEVIGSSTNINEILSYKKAHNFATSIINSIGPGKPYHLTQDTINEIHRLLTENILPPHLTGKYREKQIIIRNTQTGEISYTPPPAVEVGFMLEDLVNWVNSRQGKAFHPVIKAGIIHFEMIRIHPFTATNAKTTQLLTYLVLSLDNYHFHQYLCLEEFYDHSPLRYFSLAQKVARQKVLDSSERDLTEWLEYFVEGLASEATGIRNKVSRVSRESHIKDKFGFGIELNERQMIILEYLRRHSSMMNKDFRKIFPDFSDDTVLRELKFLKQKGLVKKIGGTKKAQYVLS